jgi:hypothetical protein
VLPFFFFVSNANGISSSTLASNDLSAFAEGVYDVDGE